MGSYQRLYTMSQNLEYRVDHGSEVDVEQIVDLFNVQKESDEYDIYRNFLSSYESLYHKKRNRVVRTASNVDRCINYSISGAILGTFVKSPFFGMLLGLQFAFVVNSFERGSVRSNSLDNRIYQLYTSAMSNLKVLEKDKSI